MFLDSTYHLPFTTTGGYIQDTKNTIVHVTGENLVNGTADVGSVWALSGTVGTIISSSLIPFNLHGQQRQGVGPLSSANYIGVGPSLWPQFTGSWTAAIVFSFPSQSVVLGGCGAANSGGWYISVYQFCNMQFSSGTTNTAINSDSNLVLSKDSTNLVVFGFDGTLGWIQSNNGNIYSVTAPITTPAFPIQLGFYQGGGLSLNGNVYEFYLSTDVPTSASIAAISNQFFSLYSGDGQALTFTRT